MRMNKKAAFARPWLTLLLAVVLSFSSFAGLAYADDVVTGLNFDNPPSPARLYIEDDSVQLDVLASISGSSATKNVSIDATWTSTNSSIVKVANGLITGLAKGTATVSATYKGYKVSLPVTVDYLYDSVTIKNAGATVDSAVNVKLGNDLNYSLVAAKSGSADEDVTDDATWTTSNSLVATVDDGNIKLLAPGETTITARYKGRTDTVKLTVTSPYKSLTIKNDANPDWNNLLEFTVGDGTKLLTATGQTTSGGTETLDDAVWTTSSAAIATVDGGIVTPVAAGTATITATYLGVSATATVVVRPAYEALRITPKEDQHLTLQDAPVAFKAEVLKGSILPNNVTAIATWTSSNLFVATVSSSGVVTPKGVGSTVIKATYLGNSQQVNVTVYPTITTMTVAKDAIDAFVDDAVTLPKISATSIADETVDVSNLVVWSSSDTTIIDKTDGKWKAKKAGTVTLTGTTQGKSVIVTVSVHEHPILMTADQANLSVVIGKDTKLPAITMTYDNGEEEDVTALVTWKSSSTNLIVKAPNVKGVLASSVTLTASYLGKTATVRVTIEEEITKLTVDNAAVTMSPDRSYTIKVTGTYKSGKTISLTSKMNWSIDPETLATVKGSSVRTLKEGTGKLTGIYQGKSVVFSLNVVGKLKKLTPSSKALTLGAQGSDTVTVSGEYEGGRISDVTKAATWTTGNSKVATVTNGAITAVAKGTTYIRANLDGKSASIRVTVK